MRGLEQLSIGFLNIGVRNMSSQADRDRDQHGGHLDHERQAKDREKGVGRTVGVEKAMDNCEEQTLIREYMRLHGELKAIAVRLAPAAGSDDTVFEVDGAHYQVLKKAAALSYEIPVMVRPFRVVRSLARGE